MNDDLLGDLDLVIALSSEDRAGATRKRLKVLEKLLRKPRADLMGSLIIPMPGAMLKSTDVPLAETLYRRVVERGGPGSMTVQEGLLGHLVITGDPHSLPFFQEMIGLKVKRDRLRAMRKRLSITGIAITAKRHAHTPAAELLEKLAWEGEPEVRALSIQALYTISPQPPAEPLCQLLERLAVEEGPFQSRHAARRGLKVLGRTAPLDHPGGVIAFRLMLGKKGSSFELLVALRSEQTLDDLHHAIIGGLGWDADHLYCFSTNDSFRDSGSGVPGLTPLGERINLLGEKIPDAGAWRLGELGLVIGVSLEYLFDFGDNHRFTLTVHNICERVGENERFPQEVKKTGKPPKQYWF